MLRMLRSRFGLGVAFAVGLLLAGGLLTGFPSLYKALEWRLGQGNEEMNSYYFQMRGHLIRQDRSGGFGYLVMIGDSHIQGLNVSEIENDAVNLGIGGDTTQGLLARLGDYYSLRGSKLIVIMVGYNDFQYRDLDEIVDNYSKILASLTPDRQVVLLAVLPTLADPDIGSNEDIKELNLRLRERCESNCEFLDVGPDLLQKNGTIDPKFFWKDGVHLSPLGARLLKRRIRDKVWLLKGKGLQK